MMDLLDLIRLDSQREAESSGCGTGMHALDGVEYLLGDPLPD